MSGRSEQKPCLVAGSEPKGLRRNRALSEEHGNDRIGLKLLNEGEERPQQMLKLYQYCPKLWRAWLGQLAESIQNGELQVQLSQALLVLIHGVTASLAQHSQLRTPMKTDQSINLESTWASPN